MEIIMEVEKNGEYRSEKMTVHYKDGNIHRDNGPAIEGINGDKFWYKNGELHREDGPAIEYAGGQKRWHLNGELHREDGPAIEYSNGSGHGEWYLNGRLHREDGPAIDSDVKIKNGEYIRGWYLNGVPVTEDEHKSLVAKNKAKMNIKAVNDKIANESCVTFIKNKI
jgi:hypothetical protein